MLGQFSVLPEQPTLAEGILKNFGDLKSDGFKNVWQCLNSKHIEDVANLFHGLFGGDLLELDTSKVSADPLADVLGNQSSPEQVGLGSDQQDGKVGTVFAKLKRRESNN